MFFWLHNFCLVSSSLHIRWRFLSVHDYENLLRLAIGVVSQLVHWLTALGNFRVGGLKLLTALFTKDYRFS